MSVTVTHQFVNQKPDGADATITRPSDWNAAHTVTGLATVATTGAYTDLTGQPALFSGIYSDLSGKPTLFSGLYADLSGKPVLGTAAATAITDYATAAQGAKADTALQNAAAFATAAQGAKADTALQSIADGTVTLAKQANVATATVFYRKTAGTGVPEVQTLATLKTDLALTGTNSGDQTSIVGITGTIAQFNTACTDADFATGGGTASGTNTGDQTTVSGNAGSATVLQVARLINGVSFNGSADITITAADPSYSPGSFTIATETARLIINHLKLTTTQRATIAGTGRLRLSN